MTAAAAAAARALDPRADITPALEALVADVVGKLPRFADLRAHDLLVVALGAHGTAAATVRSLDHVAKRVTVDGKRRRIELGLRPPFFRTGDAPRRLATLVHELLHLDPRARGALLDENRHAKRPHAALEADARRIARAYLGCADVDATLQLPLAHDGEVLVRQWLHRPCETTRARAFTDADVFLAPIRIVTPADARGSWW